MMGNNFDAGLKPDNISLFASRLWPHRSRSSFVRDIGDTFGGTGRIHGTRDDLERFQEHRFITGMNEDRVFVE